MYFEYDALNNQINAFLIYVSRNANFELPHIKKKNRIFRVDNILVLENFLIIGENTIYIVNNILSEINNINFKTLIENLSLFDTEEQK